MKSFFIRLLINAIAIAVTITLVPGINYTGGIGGLLGLAFIFGVVNAVIKPIFSFLTCGFYIVTLGLFTFIANAIMLNFTSVIAETFGVNFTIDTLSAAVIGALVISIISFILSMMFGEKKKS
ncbi:MAG: phage holin family protein [Leptolinea sp.]